MTEVAPVTISLDEDSARVLVSFTEASNKLEETLSVNAKAQELEDRISLALQIVIENRTALATFSPDSKWLTDQMLRKLLGAEYSQWISDLDIEYDNGQRNV